MQIQTTSAPAATGPLTGLELKPETFKHAIEKALTLKPRVEYVSLAKAMVETANHTGKVCVSFSTYGSGLWVSCSCQMYHALHDRRDYPRACFHAAAAALDRNLFAVPQPIGAIVDEKRLESLTFDTAHRTRSSQQKQERFRPVVVPTTRQINAALDWIEDSPDATTSEDFVNKFNMNLFTYLLDRGYIGFEPMVEQNENLLVVIQRPAHPDVALLRKPQPKSTYTVDGWDL